jgi:hypothetical protein
MRNLNKPVRYNVASIQAQQTLGGDVMQSDENGNFVEWRDYQWLLTEKQRLDAEVDQLVHKVNYWRIEAETDNARWLRCLEDKERLERAGDLMLKYACANVTYPCYATMAKDWQTAKEDKQS